MLIFFQDSLDFENCQRDSSLKYDVDLFYLARDSYAVTEFLLQVGTPVKTWVYSVDNIEIIRLLARHSQPMDVDLLLHCRCLEVARFLVDGYTWDFTLTNREGDTCYMLALKRNKVVLFLFYRELTPIDRLKANINSGKTLLNYLSSIPDGGEEAALVLESLVNHEIPQEILVACLYNAISNDSLLMLKVLAPLILPTNLDSSKLSRLLGVANDEVGSFVREFASPVWKDLNS